MRFPQMEKSRQYRLTVPALNGGLNLQDAPNLVEDNQLTDVQNMWWKDQALRTRPGLRTDADKCEAFKDSNDGIYKKYTHTVYFPGGDLFYGGEYKTAAVNIAHTSEPGQIQGEECTVKLVKTDGTSEQIKGVSVNDLDGDDGPYGRVMLAGSSAGEEHYLLLFHAHGSVWKRQYTWGSFQKVTDFYVPTIYINGRGYDRNSAEVQTTGGTLYEGFNLLTGAFKASYTTDGKSNFFRFPFGDLTSNPDETVEITLTQQEGDQLKEFTFTIPYNKEWSSEEPTAIVTDDDAGRPVEVFLDRKSGYFGFVCSGNGPITYVSPSAFQPNNLVVRAWKTDKQAQKKICGMSINTWFGGDRSGISGGTRLFVAGNPRYPNLVHWSDVNNPLYFPENNYAYIGGADQRVTAFGKQADMLVIFKEHEIYYATYASRTITGEEVLSGAVIDVTASIAYFPVTQLHAFIGCDCPGSVQLCNNRLVWADSTGRVYALCSTSTYNDRNVMEISEPIESGIRRVSGEALLQASSALLENYYLLQAGNFCFLMDFTSNEFLYNTSYTSRKGNKIPWYLWDLSACGFALKKVSAYDGMAVFIGEIDNGDQSESTWSYNTYQILAVLDAETDTAVKEKNGLLYGKTPIHSAFQTKQFDFGYPERRKTIRRLHLGASDTAGGHIALSYLTENGAQGDAYRLELYGEGDMREWTVTPGVSRVRRFGLRAESEGAMAVDNLTLRYEVGGEVR